MYIPNRVKIKFGESEKQIKYAYVLIKKLDSTKVNEYYKNLVEQYKNSDNESEKEDLKFEILKIRKYMNVIINCEESFNIIKSIKYLNEKIFDIDSNSMQMEAIYYKVYK